MDDVGGLGLQQHLLVGLAGVAFLGGDKARAEVREVGAEQLRGENLVAMVEAAGQQQGLVEELADLGDQGERAPGAGVATSPGGHRDQAIDPGFGGFFGVPASGHVVEHQATVAVYGIHHFLHGAEAGDDDRHALFHADGQVGLQTRVAVVNDQVDCVGRRIVMQAGLDFLQPGAKAAAVALIEGGKAADHTAVAAGQYQLRVGHQKHRRRHYGQAQALLQQSRQGHGYSSCW